MLNGTSQRWGYAFLKVDGRLTETERNALYVEAVDMYLNDQEKRRISSDTYEGIMTKGSYGMVGSFGGETFEVELDLEGRVGKCKVSFLVNEQTGSSRTTRRSKKEALN